VNINTKLRNEKNKMNIQTSLSLLVCRLGFRTAIVDDKMILFSDSLAKVMTKLQRAAN
jgi:hypothetical protein